MRIKSKLGTFLTVGLALVMMSASVAFAKTSDYHFKVHNNTRQAIKKIQVSEDGKKWGFFDIGDGIGAGATEELVWDKATDDSNCEWWFKAQFADGEWSDAVKFDFCEKGLVLEFN